MVRNLHPLDHSKHFILNCNFVHGAIKPKNKVVPSLVQQNASVENTNANEPFKAKQTFIGTLVWQNVVRKRHYKRAFLENF